MRSIMTNTALRWTAQEWLTLIALTALIVPLAVRGPLGLTADPLRVLVVSMGVGFVLVLVARYPAAFIAPMLFTPPLMEVPALRGLGPAENLTALQLVSSLVAAGAILRWLSGAYHAHDSAAWDSDKALTAFRIRDSRRARIGFLVFAVVVAASYTYTLAPNYGGTKLLQFLTLGCGLFFVPILLFQSERDFRDFTIGAVLFGLLVSAISVNFSATGALGAGDNPAHIGKGQAIGFAILLLMYWRFSNRRLRLWLLLLCIPCLALGLVTAETRGPLFSLFFVLLAGIAISSMRPPKVTRKQLAVVAATIVGAGVLLSTNWFYGNEATRFSSKSGEIVALLEGSGEVQGTAVMRLEYYEAAVGIWLQHPLRGWGVGGWSMVYWQRDYRQYPHNLIFETLAEEGLLGMFALAYFLRCVFRQLRECRMEIADMFPVMFPGLIYMLGLAMFSGAISDNRFVWFWCGLSLSGCELALRARNKQELKADLIGSYGGSQSVSVIESAAFDSRAD
jgi:O-antigen ligase